MADGAFPRPDASAWDFVLQLVGRMFDHVLAARGERVTIIGATSGDTGSAAIEACRDRDNIDVYILFPEGKSEVQQRQMTTVDAASVHAVMDGTFDDRQDLVKAMFNDPKSGRRTTCPPSIRLLGRVRSDRLFVVAAVASARRAG